MHLTLRGLFLFFLAAPLLALGTWLPVMPWLALLTVGVAVGLIIFDWRWANVLYRVELKREHDTRLSLGVDNAIHLTVNNRSRRPLRFWLRDEPPDAFVIERRLFEGEVAPQTEWQTVYHVRPLRRGDYAFGDLVLRWRGPLGLVIRQAPHPAAAAVKVYPNLVDVRRYDLLLRRNRLQEFGLRHARVLGEGTEFERLRDYVPDDDFRRISWKATARRHQPITVQYQTERSQTILPVLDVGRMMQSPVDNIAKLDYAVNAVLLLTYVATSKGDKVGLLTFAQDVGYFLAPRQGRGQFYRALELLYAVEAQPVEPDYNKALTYLALKHRRRALVVIFTDLSSGLSLAALTRQVVMLSRTSLPLVVTISDPTVEAAARQRPADSLSVYQRAAAAQLLDERQRTLDLLRRNGALTLDVPANKLSVAVIDRYLAIKARTQL